MTDPRRVLLVITPWASPIFPGLGAALLRSVLERDGIGCDILYANLIFSRIINGDPGLETHLAKLPICEIAFGCYMACCIYISVAMYMWWGDKASLASIPFLLIFAGGYFYVGVGSVYALWKMHMDAQEEFAEAAEIAGL